MLVLIELRILQCPRFSLINCYKQFHPGHSKAYKELKDDPKKKWNLLEVSAILENIQIKDQTWRTELYAK